MRSLVPLALVVLASCSTEQTSTSSGSGFTDCEGNSIERVENREPVLCTARAPTYPRQAQSAGIEGVCVTTFDVGVDGRVRNESVTCKPQGVFEEAALASKKYFRYLPKVIGGVPVNATGMSRRDTFKL